MLWQSAAAVAFVVVIAVDATFAVPVTTTVVTMASTLSERHLLIWRVGGVVGNALWLTPLWVGGFNRCRRRAFVFYAVVATGSDDNSVREADGGASVVGRLRRSGGWLVAHEANSPSQ